MKKSKKSNLFMTGMATAVAVSSIAPTVSAEGKFFSDVEKSSALYNEILDLYTQGKIDGFKDGTFRQYETVTRGQAAKIIASMLELDTKSVKDPGMKDLRKDAWYYGSVAALVEAKVVSGFKDNTFRPNQALTRAEASRIISEAFKLKYDAKRDIPFKDVEKGTWYYQYIQAFIENRVTHGKTKDRFAPNDKVTRGELVAFASRANKAQEKTYNVESVQNGKVTIDGHTYEVASALKGLFNDNNQSALKNAKISFDSKDGVIQKVKSLTLTNSGSSKENVVLDAVGAVIDGSVIVQGDYYELKNLTINGDLSITNSVQNSFISDKLTVKGNTRVEEQKASTASVFRIAAENPKTKITIIFKDSTMATIEIAKEDIYFSATGSTKVETITLHANANITADPDVIIPKVDIQKGVTLVELNVTIKEIIIESNDEIKVTGKGNIDNVVINTDKTVTLDTRGQIKNLESKNENSNITVGENAKITNITVPEGKKAESVVQNFDQVKNQIEQVGGTKNPDYTPSAPVNSPSTPSTGGSSGSGSGSGQTTQPTPTADQSAADSVTNKIIALPAVGSLSLTNETAVNEAKEAFERLTDSQKALVSTGNQTKLTEAVAKIAQLKTDQVAATAVTTKVTALPAVDDITLDDETEVADVKAAFDNLTPSQKGLVIAENQTKLTEAVAKITQLKADQVAAEVVTAKITALPAVDSIVLEDESEVSDVKVSFEALTKEQKALVSTENQLKLTEAFAQIALLKADEGDVVAAAAVTEKIAGLPDLESLNLTNELAVNEAKEAFEGLSATQKDLVDILSQTKLTEAVKKIDQLKVDQAAASDVTEKIVALPLVSQITLHNEDVVSEVKVAFDGLTPAQQLLVGAENQTKLTEVVEKIAQLKADQEDAVKAAAVSEKITALPALDEIALNHETTVNDVQAAFDELTPAQQLLVGVENQTKLTSVVEKIAQLKADQEDGAKAAAVTEKIVALPAVTEITLAHETAVKDAKKAFDALTTDQKALVLAENQTKLVNAVTRINELHDQNSNPTNPGDETGEYFDAGLTKVEGRFGYVKLNLFNQGNYKVKYLVVHASEAYKYQNLKAGDAVPENAIEYKSGDEFILWTSSEVFAYQVDSNDKIIEPVDINEVWHTFPIDIKVDQEQSKLRIKVLVNPAGKTNEQLLNKVYLFSSSNAYKMDLSKGTWTSVDGIQTIELPLDDMDSNVQYQVFVEGYQFNALTYVNYTNINFKEEKEKTDLVKVKYAAKSLEDEFSWFISDAVYEEVSVTDEDGNTHTNRERIAEQDSVSIAKYKAEIMKRENALNTIDDLKNLVKEVNALPEIKGKVDIYKNAASAVEALYKEDQYDYEEDERLKEGVTQADIDQAKSAVEKVDNSFKEKERLLREIENAQYWFVNTGEEPSEQEVPLLSATASAGSVTGTTKIEATPAENNHLMVKVSSTPISTPNSGGSLEVGTDAVDYESGNDIVGVDTTDNKYIAVYEVSNTDGKIVKFRLIQLKANQINNGQILSNLTADDKNNILVGAQDGMEYSIDEGKTWVKYSSTNAPTFEGNQTVAVRLAEGSEVKYVDFTTNPPEIKIIAFKEDYNLNEPFDYNFLSFRNAEGEEITIDVEDIKIEGFDSSHYQEAQEVKITVNGVTETNYVDILPVGPIKLIEDHNLDTIFGLDHTMEFKVKDTENWIKYDGTNLPDLSGQKKIYVRYSATSDQIYSHEEYFMFRDDYFLLDSNTKSGTPTDTLTFVWNVDQMDEVTFTSLENKKMDELFQLDQDSLNVFGDKDIKITDVTWDNSGEQLKSTFTLADPINMKDALGVGFQLKGMRELNYWVGYSYIALYKASDNELLELLLEEVSSKESSSMRNIEEILEYMSEEETRGVPKEKIIDNYTHSLDDQYVKELKLSASSIKTISDLQDLINKVNESNTTKAE